MSAFGVTLAKLPEGYVAACAKREEGLLCPACNRSDLVFAESIPSWRQVHRLGEDGKLVISDCYEDSTEAEDDGHLECRWSCGATYSLDGVDFMFEADVE